MKNIILIITTITYPYILSLLFLYRMSSCELKSTKVVYKIEPIDKTYCRYRYYDYRWMEGAERVGTAFMKDSIGKYSVGDTIKKR